MNCPHCRIALKEKKIGSVKVNVCSQCRGSWFDKGELRQAKDQADPDLNWMDFDLWKHEDRFHVDLKPLKCPRCEVEMMAVEYDRTGVEINPCPKCRGVWLQAGEFEKIIKALEEELDTKSTSDYIKASLAEAREILTGSESIVSEWRDFLTVMRMLEYRILVENPKLNRAIDSIQKGVPIR